MPVSNLVSSWNGDLTLRALANFVGKQQTTNPGAPPIRRQGDIGAGIPEWKAVFTANYRLGPLSLFLQERFISSGKYDNTLTERDISDNTVPAVWYTDVNASYAFDVAGAEAELFGSISNLFDKDPPVVPTFFLFGGFATNQQVYDVVGRSFSLGLRLRY